MSRSSAEPTPPTIPITNESTVSWLPTYQEGPTPKFIRPSAMGLNEPSVDSCFNSRFEGDLEGAERFIAM